MRKAAVTIKDIAKALGLSKSTVSRALSDHSSVNKETRKKILDLAQKLHYEPNPLALNFKQKRTKTIGVIIPETVNKFFARAIGGIQHVAHQAGYNVITCESDESYESEKSNLQSLVNSRVDGMLISVASETDRTDHFDMLVQKGIPVVFFDRIREELNTSQVVTDNYEIAFAATEHLISQGCKKIAILAGPSNLYNSRNRLRGYVDALKKHGLPVRDHYVFHSQFRAGNFEEHARAILDLRERPDAVFAINDYAALELIHFFKKHGLRIPEDIAVMGFNNEVFSKFVEPALSTVDLNAHDLGAAATEILLEQINDPGKEPQKKIIKSKLIVRASTQLQP
ncbi:MAG TPA: LacI family DNA-binding transcriptional regulator, partial [Cyclobacteriaceae bacterium]|nr:LacI family DNA-binding transcriptional regulator [Cyclobacteriaceae bacterium]